jgi:glycerol uptake facilitator protein
VAAVAEPRELRPPPLPVRFRRSTGGEYWAEFFGTFILICFGDGVVAMLWALVGSGRSSAGPLQSSGDWLLITWGWCLAVVFAVYTAGGISGAHINPAVSLGQAMRGLLPWRKVPGYWIAQVAGAFVGAALVWAVYNAAINNFDTTHHSVKGTAASVATYSTFATFPAAYFHTWIGPFVDQVVGTFFLCLFIFALTDDFNLPVRGNLGPWVVGFVVMAIGISFGANAGYAINPARDLGPRLFAWAAGWGKIAFPGDYGNINTYFWIPIIGPLLGGAIAAFFYNFGIQDFLKARMGPEEGTGRVPHEAPVPGTEEGRGAVPPPPAEEL